MKTLLLTIFTALFAAELSVAADGTVCRMSNERFCALPSKASEIEIQVHNSGRPGLCGLKLLTNKNLAFSGLLEFADGLEASIDLPDRGKELAVRRAGNTLYITDASRDQSGILPPMFVIPLKIKTKSGETFQALAERTIEPGRAEPGSVELVAVPVRCLQ